MLAIVRAQRQVVCWFVLGATAAGVELMLLRLLFEFLAWPLAVATAVAAETLILVKFAVADRWIFSHPRPTLDRLLKYHGASAGALVVYWLIINSLAVFAGLAYPLAFVLATGASFAWSLATNFLWVWSNPSAARGAGR
jgi:putative flippase GtrA